MPAPVLKFPSVKLTITPLSGDGSLDISMWITTLEWTESNDELNTLSVTLTVPEADTLGSKSTKVKSFHDQAFMPGGSFKLEFFDHSASAASTTPVGNPRTGDIVRVRHGLSASGRRTVTLTGMEALHRLKGLRISTVANEDAPKELADLLTEVAEQIKLSGEAQGSVFSDKVPIILDQSTLGLVKQIAEKNDKVVVLDAKNSKLILQDVAANSGGDVTVTWGFDLTSVNLTLDLSGQASKVELTGLNLENLDETAPMEFSAVTLERQSGGVLGTALRKKAFGETLISMTPWRQELPVGFPRDPDNLETMGKALFQNMSDGFVRGSLSCIGKPGAAQNAKVTVESAPWPFAGTFVIDSVNHSYSPDEGLTTEISFFSNMVKAQK